MPSLSESYIYKIIASVLYHCITNVCIYKTDAQKKMHCEKCHTPFNVKKLDCWDKNTPKLESNTLHEGLLLLKYYNVSKYQCTKCMKGKVIGSAYNQHYIIRGISTFDPYEARIKPYEFD